MYGLPGQSLDVWVKTLEQALSFSPEHLSCYQLTIEAGETPAPHETPALWTPMARRAARGEICLPDEETQREFFLLTANFLTARGYVHYEVANFARQGPQQGPQAGSLCYCCHHNLKYWTRTPYLGLGPAAHSFDGRRRWWNVSSLGDYCASLNAGRSPVAGEESLTPEQIRLETLALGFRTREGVRLATIRERPGGDAMIAALTRAGLVRVDHDRVVATLDGLVVADRLPLGFAD
jgi:coproporphyrinogen III oxidase-like Fe-S oxidoreductase